MIVKLLIRGLLATGLAGLVLALLLAVVVLTAVFWPESKAGKSALSVLSIVFSRKQDED